MRGATSHQLRSLLTSSKSIFAAEISSSSRGFASAGSHHTGFVEIREYTLKPNGMVNFINLAQETSALRSSLLPFLGMFSTDTGDTLNRVVHMYHYPDWESRDAARRKAAQTAAWATEFIPASREFVTHQRSSIFLPAAAVLDAAQSTPIQNTLTDAKTSGAAAAAAPALYELRQYQLHPGYGSVPKLISAFEKGVPSKIAADPEDGKLVYFGYTDVGQLNTVVELWRYPSTGACMRARQAARKVPEWRETIAAVTPGVQFFRSTFLNPLPFSPLQ